MLRAPATVWLAFAAVHATILVIGVFVVPARAFWDLDLYRWWMWLGLHEGEWPVLSGPWVYPVGAVVPMFVAALGGTELGTGYATAWTLLVTALNAVGLAALLHAPTVVGHRHIPRTSAGAWWWVGFVALLGPVAIGRLDAVVAPMVVVALVVALRHPRLAAVLLTAGAWVKAAPGALVAALWFVVRRPWRDVALPAALVCLVVVGLTALGGGLGNITSFLDEQDARGLQVEAVGATPWLLASLVAPQVTVELNEQLITWEIHGPGTQGAADALGALFVVGLAAAALLLWWCRRRLGERVWSDDTARSQLLVRGAMLVSVLLIVLNKVGSPQYIGWIGPPVAVALALRLPRWRPEAWLVAGIALATQIVFPWGYGQITSGGWGVTLVLAARNAALVALVVHLVARLVRESRPDVVLRRPTTAPAATDLPVRP